MSQVIQYELWRECNCHCSYCTLGKDNLQTSNKLKLQSIQTAIDEIKEFKLNEHETLGFIGGEFFQGQLSTLELKDKFFELMKLSNDVMNKGIIKNFWLNASLLIGEQEDFYKTLDLFDNKKNVWVLTSYDTMGRFHSEKMFTTWENHIKKIHTNYPDVNLNITSILTGDFIDKYLNNEFELKAFAERYKSTLFFKNPVPPSHYKSLPYSKINEKIGNFFPTRKKFLEFLRKFKEKENLYEYERLISTDLRADEVRKNYNNGKKRNVRFLRDRNTLCEVELDGLESVNLSCGHSDAYKSYVDSDKCCLCDKQMIKEFNLN